MKDYNTTVYTVLYDCKGYPYIEKNILADRIREFAEETTSPRGVMPKLFVEDNELRLWHCNGRSSLVMECESEEEANQEWLERTYECDYLENCYNDFDTPEEAVADIAERMELDEEVVKSLLRFHEKYRIAESKRKAHAIMKRVERAKENAKRSGVETTKELRRAISDAKFPCYYMWGRTLPFDSPSLDVKSYYTEEFINELKNN